MKFEIIGSGGCVSLPKPLCNCQVCVEAREKGRPYSRNGPSLYLHDIHALIDTPEDIVQGLNQSTVKTVDYVLYSHMDPDHTLGFRVFEQLKLNWFDVFEGRECSEPISVIALPHVAKDLQEIQTKYGSYLDYYEYVRKLIQREETTKKTIENVSLEMVPCGQATVFVFTRGEKKAIYAPCDVKPFPENELFMDADLMIIGNTFVGDTLKGGYQLTADNPLRDELFSMDEICELKATYNIKAVVVTHLEEDWGKSYDDYKALEASYDNIRFAYDGMILEV